jgi:hypothetical protein
VVSSEEQLKISVITISYLLIEVSDTVLKDCQTALTNFVE